MTTALEEQRTQNALHLREQMKACRSELEMEMMIDKEKNQLLLSRYQRDNTQLQQKVYEVSSFFLFLLMKVFLGEKFSWLILQSNDRGMVDFK